MLYAPGKHILLDFSFASYLTDAQYIEKALRAAAEACGATVLNACMHSFGKHQGVTGVLLLAESHITIHTWPESHFMAIDVFMCGHCDALQAVDVLKDRFMPKYCRIHEASRGSS